MYRAPSFQKPSRETLADLSAHLGLDIAGGGIGQYHDVVCGLLDKSLPVLDKYVEPKLPVKYPRTPGYRPAADENTHNAWYYKTEIPGAESGRLHGRTVVVKDCVPVAGVPMMNGSRVMEGYVPDYDATVVTKLLDAGACKKEKSTYWNFCLSVEGWTCATGPVLNAHDKSRSSGGSSSGSAVLVALGEVDLAVGGDQGGSIRVPASYNGIVGLKPTNGLVPYTGVGTFSPALDSLGPMTRTVTDCARMLEVMAGHDGGLDPRQTRGPFDIPPYTEYLTGDLSGMKIALLEEGFEGCEPDVSHVVRQAALTLTQKGATVEDISIPIHHDAEAIYLPLSLHGIYFGMIHGAGHFIGPPAYMATSAIENWHAMGKARMRDYSELIKSVCLLVRHLTDAYGLRFYSKATNLMRVVAAAYDEKLREYDVIIMPTTKIKAAKILPKETPINEFVPLTVKNYPNCSPFNGTGHPALTINAAYSEGLPVGMMIVGRQFDDQTVLKVAHAYEQLRDATV